MESKFDLAAARHHADTGGLMNTTKWLHAALDEIERQVARIKELDTEAQGYHDRKEELAGILAARQPMPMEQATRELEEEMKLLGARIKELEGWLIEERKKQLPPAPDAYWSCRRDEAIRQLTAEGKISNSDHVVEPNKLTLTAEQRDCLEYAIESLCPPDNDYIDRCVDVLRGILSGSGVCHSKHAWEVTEARKSAILDGMMAIARLQQIGEEQWGDEGEAGVLRAMLEEAGQ